MPEVRPSSLIKRDLLDYQILRSQSDQICSPLRTCIPFPHRIYCMQPSASIRGSRCGPKMSNI